MNKKRLSNQELQQSLLELNQGAISSWEIIGGKLHKTFVFRNFIEAFGFMVQAAIEAEKMDHHPEWCNVYKTVAVDLTTHEANGITQLDLELAAKMNAVAASD